MEKKSLFKKKFNLSEGWEISEWQFWRNICLENNFPSKMILKANKKYPWSQNCMSEKPDSYVCSNFLFHRTWWVSLPLRAVCHPCQDQAVGSRHIPRVCMAPHLPGRSCSFRAQSWLMAAGGSLGSWLKSAPLESKKGDCCIPVCPWDPSVRFALGSQPSSPFWKFWAAVLAQAGVLAAFICLAGK